MTCALCFNKEMPGEKFCSPEHKLIAAYAVANWIMNYFEIKGGR